MSTVARRGRAEGEGRGDPLSGRHLSVNDDLDSILSRLDQVARDDLYLLRRHCLLSKCP
jgi:hypothetical protein